MSGWTQKSDRRFVAILILIPLLGLGLPAVFGQPLVPGDDLFQNFPLRLLAGQLLSKGLLPLWNPWAWSGTPLLGGLNAGALYPGTLLFAVASPVFAWTVNEIAIYAVFGVGAYALFRHHRLAPSAALVGAASGSFAGLLAIHLCNFGLVQGLSWTPLLLLALDHCALPGRSKLGWWTLLATTGGLVILSGEPRAISNVAITAAVYLVGLLWRAERRWTLAALVAGAALAAFALGAVQLLPGLHFAASSQRGKVPYEFFSQSSLDLYYWQLQFVPFLLGQFHAQSYELRADSLGYVGLLPLVALLTFPFWRKQAGSVPWTWLALVGVGLVLSVGPNSPLGPLFYRIPLYGAQRMQYRNMGIAEIGLIGLLASWADTVLGARVRSRVERWTAVAPPLLAIGIIAFARFGPQLQDFYEGAARELSLSEVWPYRSAVLLLAAGAGAFAFAYDSLSHNGRVYALLGLVAFDLAVGLSQQDLASVPLAPLLAAPPETAEIAAALAGGGRFALYDPKQRARKSALLSAITPNMAGLHGLASVQGFGSIVDGTYSIITSAHQVRHLDHDLVGSKLADDLDLRVLFVPESYLSPIPQDPRPTDLQLEGALDPSHWREVRRFGDLRSFLNVRAHGHLWTAPADNSIGADNLAPPAELAVVQRGEEDRETDRVSSQGAALLVRSVAFAEGWKARILGADGTSQVQPVLRHGLLQAAPIPAGPVTVEWWYDPPGARLGLALSALGAALLASTFGIWLGLRLRRRPLATTQLEAVAQADAG